MKRVQIYSAEIETLDGLQRFIEEAIDVTDRRSLKFDKPLKLVIYCEERHPGPQLFSIHVPSQ